jgi:hypothetical protein
MEPSGASCVSVKHDRCEGTEHRSPKFGEVFQYRYERGLPSSAFTTDDLKG